MNYIQHYIRVNYFLVLLSIVFFTSLNAQNNIEVEQHVKSIISWSKRTSDSEVNSVKDSLRYAIQVSKPYPYAHALALTEYLRFILIKTGDFDLASEIMEDFAILKQNSTDPRVASLYHFSKGKLFSYEQINTKEAMFEYREALAILEEHQLDPEYDLINNYAVAELSANRFNESLKLFNKAELTYRKNPKKGDEDFLSTIMINKGVVFIHLGKLDSAEYYFVKSVELSKKQQYLEEYFTSLVFLGVFYQENNKIKEAINTLEKAQSIIPKTYRNYRHKALLFESLSDCYYQINQYKTAFDLKKLEAKYQDSLFQSGIAEKAFALDFLSEINTLKQEKQINQLNNQIEQQSFRNIILFIVSLLILIILTSAFIYYRMNKRRQILEIKAENENLEKKRIQQEAELKLLRNEEKLIKANIELSTNKAEMSNIKERLKNHLDQSFDPEFDDLKKFLTLIKSSEKRTEQLKYIDHVLTSSNNEFYKKIKEICHNISEDEIRLATFIRLNLMSDEIASIFNISNSSLMTKRYRLRKKLKLESKSSLNDFIKEL